MALNPGTRIGLYEISARIGVGGMGEVYRARDTRLGREVAIKVLPPGFTSDPDRLARLEREARILATLNHPHIGAIYRLEEEDGIRALVLELVEGPTLADRIAQAPMPLKEALTIARQIADALDAAHERGIVHRDLKPANIKITSAFVVKVLDFGLAKPTDAAPVRDMTHSPTMTAMNTGSGVILGTAAYMSPEQARGQAVDKRTDIWAFGCVLYERLTGRSPFHRATVTDTLAAIVDREPDWTALPASTSPSVPRLLRRCLDKDPKRRLRDIADACIDLEDALISPSIQTTAEKRSSWAWSWAPWLAAAAAATVALMLMVAQGRHAASVEANAQLAGNVIAQLTYDPGVSAMPSLSPDGRLISYASDRAGGGNLDIWVQQTIGGVPLRLTDDPADDSTPDFAPDGSQIAFRSERVGGGVYVVSALGGPARLLAPMGRNPRFSPDGRRIVYWVGQPRGGNVGGESALFVLALSGGTPVRVLSDFSVTHEAVWSPDGGSLLVLARRDLTSPLDDVYDWWWVPLDGRQAAKTRVMALPGLRGLEPVPRTWGASGVMFSDGQNLWSVAVSPTSGRPEGAPRRLTAGAGEYVDPTTSRDGQIVFSVRSSLRVVDRVSLSDPMQPPTRLYSDGHPVQGRTSVSRDGSVIVFERGIGKYREIWKRDLRSDRQEQVLRVETTAVLNATISPDGARLGYTIPTADAAGSGYVMEISGGTPRLICEACSLHRFLSDNRRVLTEEIDGHTIRLIDTRTGTGETVVQTADGRLDRPHASPNDQWLTFRRTLGTQAQIFVTPLMPDRTQREGTWTKIEDPTTTGRPTGWSLDSRTNLLLLDTDGFRCLWGQRIDPASGGTLGAPHAIRHFHSEANTQGGFGTSYGEANSALGFVYEDRNFTSNLWKLQVQEAPLPATW